MKQNSDKVPEPVREKFEIIISKTDTFSKQYLNEEYSKLIRSATAALCRKRPSPLQSGSPDSWAAGIIHAIGSANFLFDKSQTPHCKATDIYTFFGVASSTGQSKSKSVRDLLKIDYFSTQWTLPSRMDDNPLIWMVSINGLLVDVRKMPIHIQEEAFQKGLIPYVPTNR